MSLVQRVLNPAEIYTIKLINSTSEGTEPKQVRTVERVLVHVDADTKLSISNNNARFQVLYTHGKREIAV